MSDLAIGIAGYTGRMGQAVAAAVEQTAGVRLGAASVAPEDPRCGTAIAGTEVVLTDNPDQLAANSDAVIDFTTPAAARAHAAAAARAKAAYIVGTTGLSATDQAAIEAAAGTVPVVQAANFSLGINLLLELVERAAAVLDDRFDIEILDLHHRHKVDAPSGTALALGRAAAAGRGDTLEDKMVRARDGLTGPRRTGEIGFAVQRAGTAAGEHSVLFAGPDERIELVHRAADRMIFAHGAVAAARWATGREPGLYSMRDVLTGG